jgi:hypothetical protein
LIKISPIERAGHMRCRAANSRQWWLPAVRIFITALNVPPADLPDDLVYQLVKAGAELTCCTFEHCI